MKPAIAHLGIAVADIDAAARFYRDVLRVACRGPEEADGARILHLDFGGSEVELLEPLSPDSPIGRFLARRGPGLHHVCYRVPDLDAALAACREQGYTLIDQLPRGGAGEHRIAFLHPEATDGTLIELTE
ncbi:MAG: methylmalonyl-CoA epimerase [Gemmatimonadales bacterium]